MPSISQNLPSTPNKNNHPCTLDDRIDIDIIDSRESSSLNESKEEDNCLCYKKLI